MASHQKSSRKKKSADRTTSDGRRWNALKHGVFTSGPVILGEDEGEFDEFHHAFILEWAPQGVTEEEYVLEIASCFWAKRRLSRAFSSQAEWAETPPKTEELLVAQQLSDWISAAGENSLAWEAVKLFPKDYQAWLYDNIEPPEDNDDKQWLRAFRKCLNIFMHNHKVGIGVKVLHPPFAAEKAKEVSELIAKDSVLQEVLNRRLEKAIRGFVTVRTFKEITIREREHRAYKLYTT